MKNDPKYCQFIKKKKKRSHDRNGLPSTCLNFFCNANQANNNTKSKSSDM